MKVTTTKAAGSVPPPSVRDAIARVVYGEARERSFPPLQWGDSIIAGEVDWRRACELGNEFVLNLLHRSLTRYRAADVRAMLTRGGEGGGGDEAA